MAPSIITIPAGSTPAGYRLAGGTELVPESLSARFDGSGAAGAFLPCLAIYAPSGELLGRTFPSDSLAVGDAAEVTFAPF